MDLCRRVFLLALPLLACSAQEPAQTAGLPLLKTARRVHALKASEAARGYPVQLRAVVTYYDPYIDARHGALFVHDATGSVFVAVPPKWFLPIRAGMLVAVSGVTGAGDFAPVVEATGIRILGQGHLPAKAPRVGRTQILTGAYDGQWVELEGVVHAVQKRGRNITLALALNDGLVGATTVAQPGVDYSRLIDTKILVRGAAAELFNRRRQIAGGRFFFPSMAQVTVEEPAPRDPFASPVRPIDSLLQYNPNAASPHRVHIRGSVTLQWPGRLICIQGRGQGLCASAEQAASVPVGDVVDVVGFPATGEYVPTLQNAVWRPFASRVPVTAAQISVAQAPARQLRLRTRAHRRHAHRSESRRRRPDADPLFRPCAVRCRSSANREKASHSGLATRQQTPSDRNLLG